jgi:hypothetical protein
LVDEDCRVDEELLLLEPLRLDFERRDFASCFAIGHLSIRLVRPLPGAAAR